MSWADIVDRTLKAAIAPFKSSAVYTRASGGNVPISGVFSRPHQAVDPESGAVVSSTHPTFGIRLADLGEAPLAGDTLDHEGITYEVIDDQPDGQGGTRLVLRRIG